MVDYSYCECYIRVRCRRSWHGSVAKYPEHSERVEIDRRRWGEGSTSSRAEYRASDGSWYGSWAVCFTYGCWFGVEGLVAGGEPTSSETVRRACKWLVSVQKADGGWGESYESCVLKRYVEHEKSQVVNTAWALLALMRGG